MLELRRVLAVFAVVSALVWAGSAAVQASGNPGRTPAPTPPDVTGDLCGLSVGFVVVHVEINQEFIKVFPQPDGTTKLTFNGRLTVSVAGNGKILPFNASGPGTVILRADGSVVTTIARGGSFVISPTGVGLWLYDGRIVVDPNGNVISNSGNVTDICALLAA